MQRNKAGVEEPSSLLNSIIAVVIIQEYWEEVVNVLFIFQEKNQLNNKCVGYTVLW